MAYCTKCGKETDWTSKSGYCKECAVHVLRERNRLKRIQWIIIGIAGCMILGVLISTHLRNSGDEERAMYDQVDATSPPNPDATPSEADEILYYEDGMYKVGDDIPSGEYMLIITDTYGAYFEVASDSSGTTESIICNGIVSTWTYITISNGQYITIERAELIPVDEAPTINPVDGKYIEGTYLIGRDLPAGEYGIALDGDYCYLEVATDSTHTLDSIKTNDMLTGNSYITVEDGEYLTISGGHIIE